MEIDGPLPPDEQAALFFIGQHETTRATPVSPPSLGQAQSLSYDFLTTPLTTASFHQRVISQLRKHVPGTDESPGLLTLIAPLSPQDTTLTPNASNSALIGVVSPWIDLASTDPTVAHVSRQVLGMEVAFAAFCGISNLIIHGPSSSNGTTAYARAVAEALGMGPYVQIHVLLPMTGDLETDGGDTIHLSELANTSEGIDDADNEDEPMNAYSAWETWDTIRTICNYSQKLSVGKRTLPFTSLVRVSTLSFHPRR